MSCWATGPGRPPRSYAEAPVEHPVAWLLVTVAALGLATVVAIVLWAVFTKPPC